MTTRASNGKANATRGRRDSRAPRRIGGMLTGTGISFSSTNTIGDTGNGLAIFGAGQRIEVRGSPLNSRRYTVATSAAGTLTVLPALVQSEVAGATITIEKVD